MCEHSGIYRLMIGPCESVPAGCPTSAKAFEAVADRERALPLPPLAATPTRSPRLKSALRWMVLCTSVSKTK